MNEKASLAETENSRRLKGELSSVLQGVVELLSAELIADPVLLFICSSLPPLSVQELLPSITPMGEARRARPSLEDQCCHWLMAITEPNDENCLIGVQLEQMGGFNEWEVSNLLIAEPKEQILTWRQVFVLFTKMMRSESTKCSRPKHQYVLSAPNL